MAEDVAGTIAVLLKRLLKTSLEGLLLLLKLLQKSCFTTLLIVELLAYRAAGCCWRSQAVLGRTWICVSVLPSKEVDG